MGRRGERAGNSSSAPFGNDDQERRDVKLRNGQLVEIKPSDRDAASRGPRSNTSSPLAYLDCS